MTYITGSKTLLTHDNNW